MEQKRMNGRITKSSKEGLFSREYKCTDHDIVSVNGIRNTFVCNLCLYYAKKNHIKGNVSNTTQEQEQNTNSKHDNNEEVEIISNNIKATIESSNHKSLSEQECSQLCITLGNYLNIKIFESSELFMDDKTYKKPTLIDYVERYLDFFPVCLVQFFTHITKDQKNMVNRRSNQ